MCKVYFCLKTEEIVFVLALLYNIACFSDGLQTLMIVFQIEKVGNAKLRKKNSIQYDQTLSLLL